MSVNLKKEEFIKKIHGATGKQSLHTRNGSIKVPKQEPQRINGYRFHTTIPTCVAVAWQMPHALFYCYLCRDGCVNLSASNTVIPCM